MGRDPHSILRQNCHEKIHYPGSIIRERDLLENLGAIIKFNKGKTEFKVNEEQLLAALNLTVICIETKENNQDIDQIINQVYPLVWAADTPGLSGYRVSQQKAQLVQQKVMYLGYEVSGGQQSLGTVRKEDICQTPRPETVRDLRTFRGMTDSGRPEHHTALIAYKLSQLNIDIVALSEVCLHEEGSLREHGASYTLYWSAVVSKKAKAIAAVIKKDTKMDAVVQVTGHTECLNLALVPEGSVNGVCVRCKQVNDLLCPVAELKEQVPLKNMFEVLDPENEVQHSQEEDLYGGSPGSTLSTRQIATTAIKKKRRVVVVGH
ncbi:hypothetical protein BTVI_39485 [Pitangus sulphuratus]|nr:hypothetical protein BTVI_39485 [Pitangus sulphuratus]